MSIAVFRMASARVRGDWSQSTLTNVSSLLPPLSEQAHIGTFMDVEYRRIEPLIAQAQKLISYLSEYRTALISAAVTSKIDVRGEGA
jgi:type I restriction enzyme S subunit